MDNAKAWRFRPVRSHLAGPAFVDIDYQFVIRGVRIPQENEDVKVIFELPNRVLVEAPFDPSVPCRLTPGE